MQAKLDSSPFDERAAAHFLDFSRDRDAVVEALPQIPLDLPRFRVLVPCVSDGDKRGANAVAAWMLSDTGNMDVDLPYEGRVIPCVIETMGSFVDDKITLTLQQAGSPKPA